VKKSSSQLGKSYKICPRCNKKGSFHRKSFSSKGGHLYRYWYTAHYRKKENKSGVKWCYIGKTLPEAKNESLNNRKSLYLNNTLCGNQPSTQSSSTRNNLGEKD
jgi:hypothetical protein|tara:strand:+ start:82 stop:393 length:312 start_codon:yes stop_codon:yes gene_type:complete